MSSNIEEDEYNSSDDEDYVPENVEDDVDEPSGDECDEVTAADDPDAVKGGRGKKRGKKAKETKSEPAPIAVTAEVQDDVDDFFNSLLASDPYAIQSSSSSTTSASATVDEVKVTSEPKPSESKSVKDETSSTTKITEVFDFAGQEITVEKEVSLEEARAHEEKEQKKEELAKKPVIKRTGGLGDALTMLAKKPKISVLDKSNLDWKSFKQEAKIDEDLASYNRGKNGYLNKQDFLLKADHAQFEKERAMRDTIRRQNQNK